MIVKRGPQWVQLVKGYRKRRVAGSRISARQAGQVAASGVIRVSAPAGPLAAISKHLVILTRAGLIAQEKRGRVKWCKLEPDALRAASVWMQGFGQFDPVDLDALERFLVQELAAGPEIEVDDDSAPHGDGPPPHGAR